MYEFPVYEIWAAFGPVSNTEKNGRKVLFRVFFLCFHGQKRIYIFEYYILTFHVQAHKNNKNWW